MKKLLKIALVALTLTAISACGFQLRGSLDIDEPYQTLALRAAADTPDLTSAVEQEFRAAGLTINNDPGVAPWLLHIESEQLKRRTASLTSSARTARFEVTLVATYEFLGPNRESSGQMLTSRATRTYDFDVDDVASKKIQERQLLREMRRYLALQIMRRYQATVKNTNPPLSR